MLDVFLQHVASGFLGVQMAGKIVLLRCSLMHCYSYISASPLNSSSSSRSWESRLAYLLDKNLTRYDLFFIASHIHFILAYFFKYDHIIFAFIF